MDDLRQELQTSLVSSERLIPKLAGVLRRFHAVNTLLLVRRDSAMHELDRYIQILKSWVENFEEKTRTAILLSHSEKAGVITEFQEEVQREIDTLKMLSNEATQLLQSSEFTPDQKEACQMIVQAFSVMLQNSSVDLEIDENLPCLKLVKQYKTEHLPSLGFVQAEYSDSKGLGEDNLTAMDELAVLSADMQVDKNANIREKTPVRSNRGSPRKISEKMRNLKSPSSPSSTRYLQRELGKAGLLNQEGPVPKKTSWKSSREKNINSSSESLRSVSSNNESNHLSSKSNFKMPNQYTCPNKNKTQPQSWNVQLLESSKRSSEDSGLSSSSLDQILNKKEVNNNIFQQEDNWDLNFNNDTTKCALFNTNVTTQSQTLHLGSNMCEHPSYSSSRMENQRMGLQRSSEKAIVNGCSTNSGISNQVNSNIRNGNIGDQKFLAIESNKNRQVIENWDTDIKTQQTSHTKTSGTFSTGREYASPSAPVTDPCTPPSVSVKSDRFPPSPLPTTPDKPQPLKILSLLTAINRSRSSSVGSRGSTDQDGPAGGTINEQNDCTGTRVHPLALRKPNSDITSSPKTPERKDTDSKNHEAVCSKDDSKGVVDVIKSLTSELEQLKVEANSELPCTDSNANPDVTQGSVTWHGKSTADTLPGDNAVSQIPAQSPRVNDVEAFRPDVSDAKQDDWEDEISNPKGTVVTECTEQEPFTHIKIEKEDVDHQTPEDDSVPVEDVSMMEVDISLSDIPLPPEISLSSIPLPSESNTPNTKDKPNTSHPVNNKNPVESSQQMTPVSLICNTMVLQGGAISRHLRKYPAGSYHHGIPDIPCKLKFRFGQFGTTRSGLKFPIGVCCNSKGEIIVADTGNHKVKIFDRDGNFVREADCQLTRPSAVVVNRRDEIFVKDDLAIHVFKEDGRYLTKVGAGIMSRPFGLAMTPNELLITLDANWKNPLVYVISQDGTDIRCFPFLALIPNLPHSKCRFLTVYRDKLIVCDLGASCVYVTDSYGKTINTFGSYGSGPGQFNEPSGVTVDREGHLIIGDSKNDRVQIFWPDGQYICGVKFSEPITRPSDIHLTADGHLLVTNFLEHQIKVYKLGEE